MPEYKKNTLYLKHITLKHFRCFEGITLDVDAPIVIIEGANGSGKTSILEALHYVCYLKSFRTHLIKDLIGFESDGFFIQLICNDHNITVGYTGKKRHIAIDKVQVESYQELRSLYQIVTLTEHDLGIVQDSPEARRAFLDYTLLLFYPELFDLFKEYKTILENRNKLLFHDRYDTMELELWTEKLYITGQEIVHKRQDLLILLSSIINTDLIPLIERATSISFAYQAKKSDYTVCLNDFMQVWKKEIMPEEIRLRRTAFGPHLDELLITFNGMPARMFSSRGQQKLIVFLLKMAQVIHLQSQERPTTFLLDDFLTDFDPYITEHLLQICKKLAGQLIFTTPLAPHDIFIQIFNKELKIISL